MEVTPDTWRRLHGLSETLLRLSDEALRAAGQQDADVYWRCLERQQEVVREALLIRAAQQRRR